MIENILRFYNVGTFIGISYKIYLNSFYNKSRSKKTN